jgi:hypothetical protein
MQRLDPEILHERRQEIESQVRVLVDLLTNDLDPEDDEQIRQCMTEQFKFWRRT